MHKPSIAIIGAGLSGLILANELADQANITLFEKARGVGGRMATRHVQMADSVLFDFDHGTQFFTAKDPSFQAWLEPHLTSGLVAEWTGKVVSIYPGAKPEDRPWPEPHYVAVPHMNSLAKHLAQCCTIHLETQVARLSENAPEGWHLTDTAGRELGLFDWVISTAPPAQTTALFAQHLPTINPLEQATMQGCFTLMLGFNKSVHHDPQPDWIAAKIRNSPIEWIAINSTKPGRSQATVSIVVHTSNAWAQEHIEDAIEQVQSYLLSQVSKIIGLDTNRAAYVAIHRWRYALKTSETRTAPYIDRSLHLASSGDWCSASRIEDVWSSAHQLATTLRGSL